MKVYFIQSTPYFHGKELIKKQKLYFVGLAPAILAAVCPPEWEFECCLETIEDVNFDSNADVIAISGMGHAIVRSIDIAKEFKKRGKTVVMGGYMVSLMPEEAKKYCDSVIIGDGELSFPQMLSDVKAGCLKPLYYMPLETLTYPLPKYEVFDGKRIGNFLPVQAGRGCPNACSFCSVYCLYKTHYMRREISEVIRDIRRVRELGYRRFLLLDDNILSDRTYMLALCAEIKKLSMTWMSQCDIRIADDPKLLRAVAESGCVTLSFGIESISQESLDTMHKSWAKVSNYATQIANVRNAGIDVSTEMVLGADGDTVESIRATADFITKNKVAVPRFYILTPIPGTKYYDEMKEQGRLATDSIYEYNGASAVHIPLHMTPQQLTDEYWQLYKKVYSLSSITKRTLFHRGFLRHPIKNLFYFYVNLFYRYQIYQGITPNII